MPHQVLRFGLSAAGKAKLAALPEKNPAHLFAVQVSYCAGSVLLTKMLHFKRAKSAFAALCNVEKRQAVWYNREHADNTRLDFRRASPQSKRMDFNIMNKNSFRYKNKRRTGKLRSFLSPAWQIANDLRGSVDGWGFKNYQAEANKGGGLKVPDWVRVYLSYILPLLLLVLIVQGLIG